MIAIKYSANFPTSIIKSIFYCEISEEKLVNASYDDVINLNFIMNSHLRIAQWMQNMEEEKCLHTVFFVEWFKTKTMCMSSRSMFTVCYSILSFQNVILSLGKWKIPTWISPLWMFDSVFKLPNGHLRCDNWVKKWTHRIIRCEWYELHKLVCS